MTLSPTSVFQHPAIIFHHCSITNRLVLILMLMQPVHQHYTNFVIRNTIQKAPSKGEYFDSLPSSFAILINLGLDGTPRNMYSSKTHNDLCSHQQIWDPFSRQCRQLYCKDHYEIKDLKCVTDNKVVANSSEEKSKPFIKFLDSRNKFVNVSLGISTNREMAEQWLHVNQATFASQFIQQFGEKWSINANQRITNATVQYVSKQSANVNFLIKDHNDGMNNDDILSSLSQEVISRKQKYSILGRTFTAVSIHTTLAEMTDFCLREEDMPIWYWNDDFTILNPYDNLTMIYVNKTGRLYYPGEFLAEVLLITQIDPNALYQMNVSSNAVVCEQTLIDETCPRILLNHSEYEFVNGRHLASNGRFFSKFELTDNQSVFVCLESKSSEARLDSLDKRIESILSTVLMVVSITLLTLTLVTYLRLRSLRSTINGFNSINLVSCLAVMQITFLGNQFLADCRVPAALFHFFVLATISWSSVIAFDLHRVFVKANLYRRPNDIKTRLVYSTVAYLCPACLIAMANLGDILGVEAIRGDYGPVANSCWMRRKSAAALYFIAPVTVAVFFNLMLYLLIIFNIRSEIKSFSSFKKVTRIPSSSSQNSTISVISSCETVDSRSLDFNQTSIFMRLSVPLGFTWIIALFSTAVPSEYRILIRIMSYLFIIANTSQGVTLFIAFGVYKKMFARR